MYQDWKLIGTSEWLHNYSAKPNPCLICSAILAQILFELALKRLIVVGIWIAPMAYVLKHLKKHRVSLHLSQLHQNNVKFTNNINKILNGC